MTTINNAPLGEKTTPVITDTVPLGDDHYAQLQNLLKIINGLTAETEPVIADFLVFYDSSVSDVRKLALDNFYKTINGLTEDTAPKGEDLFVTYDTSASGVKYTKLQTVLSLIPISGMMINGKITPTVVSNDLVLTLQTTGGATPSAADPVLININGTVRAVTAATSCTLEDATNWFNAGGAELATKEIDYFAYAIWDSNSSVVAVAPARIPWGRLVSDFSGTSTNEKFLGNHSNYTSTDDVCVIGRFAATLSAAAGHVWTVPAFTNANLIQKPIFETRWLDWVPTYSASGSLTYTSTSTLAARYFIRDKTVEIVLSATGTLGGSASTRIGFTLPFEGEQSGVATPPIIGSGWNGNASTMCVCFLVPATPDRGDLFNYNLANWATSGTATIRATGIYEAD